MLGRGRAERGGALEAVRGRGRLGMIADHAAERPGAVERALRALQDLDPVDVVEPEVRIGRVIVEPGFAEILAGGRLGGAAEARIRDAADEQFVAARTEMGGGQARQAGDQRLGAARSGRQLGIVAVDDLDPARIGREQDRRRVPVTTIGSCSIGAGGGPARRIGGRRGAARAARGRRPADDAEGARVHRHRRARRCRAASAPAPRRRSAARAPAARAGRPAPDRRRRC